MNRATAPLFLAGFLFSAGLSPCPAQAGDLEPGQWLHIEADSLPPPRATPSASNGPRGRQRPDDARLKLPQGFASNLFATGLNGVRWLAVAGNGDVLATQPRANLIRVLRDTDGDGVADTQSVFSDQIDGPHGIAIHGGYLYVSNSRQVYRFAYSAGQTVQKGSGEPLLARGALGDGGGHSTRTLAISPDGRHLYVAVGSRGNTDEEPLPRATIQRFNLDGKGQQTFATGLRNAVGLVFQPGSERLYAGVNERDGLGDELPPDYVTEVHEGAFYGWPYAYAGPNPDPEFGHRRPDLVARTVVPDVLIRSHSAPIGLAFYDGTMFPAEYRGDAFVALQGSWNASVPRGYMVARVPFRDGRPDGRYQSFATGFWVDGEDRAILMGRPAGLAVGGDGSLLIADDVGGAIWRVSYRAP